MSDENGLANLRSCATRLVALGGYGTIFRGIVALSGQVPQLSLLPQ